MSAIFVARQPIFDKDNKVWGYEIFYRPDLEASKADVEDEDSATLQVASSLLLSPDYGFKGAYYVINVTRDFLVKQYARGINRERLVLSVSQELIEDGAVVGELLYLHSEGAKLQLSFNDFDPNLSLPFESFDIFEVPFASLSQFVDSPFCENLDRSKQRLLVSRIEFPADYEISQNSGASLFQGFYFQRPKTASLRPLSASLINRLKVLQILESEDQDVNALSRAIEGDATIALRLLKFVNSAAFSFLRRIDSVRQAVSLVGWDQLKNWLRLIIVSDIAPSGQTRELAYTSAIRARFMELLALYSGKAILADRLYLLGLFSLLEVMLDQTFLNIFKELQLHGHVEAALLGEPGGLRPWLDFTALLESGNWLRIDSAAMELGVELKTVSKAKLEAIEWANSFFTTVR